MIVLVANLGSTSFKYKLFDMDAKTGAGLTGAECVLAEGSADRIGQGRNFWSVQCGSQRSEGTSDLTDHDAAIEFHLEKLLELGGIERIDRIEAVGFKAVHGGAIGGPVKIDQDVLETMEKLIDVAPQHNPPYLAAMQAFRQRLPGVPQVAAFETGFHQTIPLARQVYGIPHEWIERLGIRRYGFHGASHRYIATRLAHIVPKARKIISCHLGGSCSICAILDGRSVANSFGMTTQTGVFHSSRVGDFDTFALMKLLKSGLDLETIFHRLVGEAGLKGLSGVSADMREVEAAAAGGDRRARLAVDAFVEACRHYIGAYLAVLNGVDSLVFTGGIGQHGKSLRAAVCRDLGFAGIHLDEGKNQEAPGDGESRIDTGAVPIWVLPTNEELIVARQTVEVLAA